MDYYTIPLKTCTKCNRLLPATTWFFHVLTTGLYGLNPVCKECRKKYTKAYYSSTRDVQLAKKREYRQNNQDKIKDYDARYSKANRDKIAAFGRKWYQSNKQKIIFKNHTYRARKRDLPRMFTPEQWAACLEYHNYCCAVCGRQLRDLFGAIVPHGDHWIPLNYKGTDNPGTVATNMICLCSDCNLSKSDKMPDAWLKERYGTRKANQILKRVQAYFEWVKSL